MINDNEKKPDNSEKENTVSYTQSVSAFGMTVHCPECNYPFHAFVDKVNRCPKCNAVLHLEL